MKFLFQAFFDLQVSRIHSLSFYFPPLLEAAAAGMLPSPTPGPGATKPAPCALNLRENASALSGAKPSGSTGAASFTRRVLGGGDQGTSLGSSTLKGEIASPA